MYLGQGRGFVKMHPFGLRAPSIRLDTLQRASFAAFYAWQDLLSACVRQRTDLDSEND